MRWSYRFWDHDMHHQGLFFRQEFYTLTPPQITWRSFGDRPYAARPAVAISDPYFLARVEPIYLDHVEWYLGERVLRQFGIDQPVPDTPPQSFHASRTGGAASYSLLNTFRDQIRRFNAGGSLRPPIYKALLFIPPLANNLHSKPSREGKTMIPIPLPVNASKEPLSSPASASPSIERKYKPAKPFLAIVVEAISFLFLFQCQARKLRSSI